MTTRTQAPLTLLESGAPETDPRAFRRALSQFATGVAIVTTTTGERPVGMAVNSFTSVSLDPPLVAWSIRRESSNLDAFLGAGHYGVSVLAADQLAVSQRFGSRETDKFAGITVLEGRRGAPLIAGAVAHFECTDVTVLEGGDHLILLGRVDTYSRWDGAPLLFAQGQYAAALPHPELAEVERVADDRGMGATGTSLVEMLKDAGLTTATAFERGIHRLGLTVAAARVLRALAAAPSTREELERATAVGAGSIEDALASLAEEGHVCVADEGVFAITVRGLEQRDLLAVEAERFTRNRLHDVPASDVEAAMRVLAALSQGDDA